MILLPTLRMRMSRFLKFFIVNAAKRRTLRTQSFIIPPAIFPTSATVNAANEAVETREVRNEGTARRRRVIALNTAHRWWECCSRPCDRLCQNTVSTFGGPPNRSRGERGPSSSFVHATKDKPWLAWRRPSIPSQYGRRRAPPRYMTQHRRVQLPRICESNILVWQSRIRKEVPDSTTSLGRCQYCTRETNNKLFMSIERSGTPIKN